MKRFIPVCIILLLVNSSLQIPKYENCEKQVLSGESVKDCLHVQCKSETNVHITTCKLIVCDKKQIGYHNGNPTEEYPACCSYPICEE